VQVRAQPHADRSLEEVAQAASERLAPPPPAEVSNEYANEMAAANETAGADEVLYEAVPSPSVPAIDPSERASDHAAPPRHGSAKRSTRIVVEEESGTESAGIKVEGIFFDETRPMALINGKIVEVGASIQGGVVTAIEPGAVTIKIDGAERAYRP
jgi:hypothetical protein